MKRIVFVVLVAAELFVLLCACGGAQEAPAPPAAEPSSSSAEEMPSAAVCMGSIRHPVHRIVQLGFFEKADELGYEGHILGLEDGGAQELFDCWLQGAREYDIKGAVCWVGDDSAYEFLKELHGMGVKTVVPHFPFSYEDAKEFVDVNVHADKSAMVEHAAEFICLKLRENNINSGVIGVSAGMHDDTDLLFKQYIMSHYPEYTVAETIMLGAEKLDSILLEGGGDLNSSALRSGIIQEIREFIAPKIFGGGCRTPVEGEGVDHPGEAVLLEMTETEKIEQDLLITWRVRSSGKEKECLQEL